MKNKDHLIEKELSSEEVYKGKLLHVFYDHARLPDGETSTREWIKHPGACAIVPIFENGDIMMIHQYRYPAKKIFLEVPAGKIDKGEDIQETARRELLEETGLTASDFYNIGHFYPAIGYANEIIHIFLAMGLSSLKDNPDFDEFVELERMPFVKAEEMVYSGEIDDAKTICSILKASKFLKENSVLK